MSQTDQARRQPAPVRPKMRNYGISTKPKGMLSWDWVDEQMAKSRSYWICTTRPDGRPHAAPVWGVWLDGTLYFGSDSQSRKARNIRHQPEIVVHLESGDNVVILEGRVEQTTDPALLKRIHSVYAPKYNMPPSDIESLDAPYFAFTPHLALAWTEQDFPNTATRWELGG